jgi:hypothetical protein
LPRRRLARLLARRLLPRRALLSGGGLTVVRLVCLLTGSLSGLLPGGRLALRRAVCRLLFPGALLLCGGILRLAAVRLPRRRGKRLSLLLKTAGRHSGFPRFEKFNHLFDVLPLRSFRLQVQIGFIIG